MRVMAIIYMVLMIPPFLRAADLHTKTDPLKETDNEGYKRGTIEFIALKKHCLKHGYQAVKKEIEDHQFTKPLTPTDQFFRFKESEFVAYNLCYPCQRGQQSELSQAVIACIEAKN